MVPPPRNPDLHGFVPDKAPLGLLIIDAINDLEFPEGDRLLRYALPMADRIAAFKRRAKAAGIPAIYVNDNFGRWQSDLNNLIEHCLEDGVRGQPVVEKLRPDKIETMAAGLAQPSWAVAAGASPATARSWSLYWSW